MIPQSYNFNQTYVIQSNLIDPQPGFLGNTPGDLIYDNHLDALEMVLDNSWELYEGTPCDVHRVLTKGVPYFEEFGMSGKYRNVNVWIGDEACPKPFVIPNLINSWYDNTMKLIADGELSPLQIAWISHHMFEVVHPFVDVNGRTGRLLFNKILAQLGEKPRIVYYEDREQYYKAIQYFREYHFHANMFINMNYDCLSFDSIFDYSI